MLRNLVDNAIRYGTGEVEVAVTTDGPDIAVSIGGPGPDLPDNGLAHAFELSTAASTPSWCRLPGWVSDSRSRSAWWSSATARSRSAVGPRGGPSSRSPSRGDRGDRPSRTLRVLVVDDDIDFRLLLGVQLDMEPDLVVTGAAGDGVEAIEMVTADPPDVVAMDLLMPRMNGFEAIESLRASHPDLGIVAYTAVAGAYAREQTERLGVELVLKSGDQSALCAALRRASPRHGTRASS